MGFFVLFCFKSENIMSLQMKYSDKKFRAGKIEILKDEPILIK